NGVWKISRLHIYPTMVTPYEAGWGKASLPFSRFEPTLRPDAPSPGPASSYEQSFVAPFHYAHPVREPPALQRAVASADAGTVEQALSRAQQQITAAEHRHSIENIQTAYG